MKPHERAKAWRLKRGLDLEQLSEMTGYSVIAIRKLEAGMRNRKAKEPHSEWVMERFRMACAGAEAQLKSGRKFEW
jgi:transcriptional regulator with XRE-family HTH domain